MASTYRRIRLLQLFIALILVCGLLRPVEGQTLPYQGTANTPSTLWWITQLGLGPAGEFEINDVFNTSPALIATTNGIGPALQASNSGTGPAGVFQGLLQTSAFQLTTAPSAGYVLTSDATGKGTWQPAVINAYLAGPGLNLAGNIFSIAAGGVTSAMLANGAVTSGKIASGAVTTSAIANGAITAAQLAKAAVTTAAIANGAVTTAAIANGAITAAQLAQGAVTAPALANGAVTAPAIANGAVTTPGIADGAVTASKLNWPISVSGSGFYLSVNNTASGSTAIAGISIDNGFGVYGQSASSSGVYGESTSGDGVYGSCTSGNGVAGVSGKGIGVYGAVSGKGYAGYFAGDVYVSHEISAPLKDFKIDHPLDPANKYLVHASIESSEILNLYRGNVQLDDNGHAVVTVPEWFDALNKNFSYQLTCVGGFAPVYILQELQNRSFEIAGGKPGLKVCWQITAERQDAYAAAHPLVVEQVKPENERGTYLDPVDLGFPETLGLDYVLAHPQQKQAATPK